MNEKDLLKMKERITSTKTEVAKLTGQRTYLMKELEEQWECSSLKEASAKLAEMEAETEALDKKIQRGIKEIQEKYPNV